MQVGIKSGDTLSALAQRFGTSVSDIVKANGSKIKDPNLIYAGDTLNIPGKKDEFVGPAGKAPVAGVGATGSTGSAGNAPAGQVGDWIKQAVSILEKNGVPASKMNMADIATIIQRESGGNPNAQNNWDINAKNGTPSIGLMQTIGPTFNANKLPGHDNIRNPVDNIIAGVRYAISRYGSVSNVPGVVGLRNGSGYRGY